MVDRFVFDDVHDLVQCTERIPVDLNIACGVCKSDARIRQCESNPDIT